MLRAKPEDTLSKSSTAGMLSALHEKTKDETRAAPKPIIPGWAHTKGYVPEIEPVPDLHDRSSSMADGPIAYDKRRGMYYHPKKVVTDESNGKCFIL